MILKTSFLIQGDRKVDTLPISAKRSCRIKDGRVSDTIIQYIPMPRASSFDAPRFSVFVVIFIRCKYHF